LADEDNTGGPLLPVYSSFFYPISLLALNQLQ
jgi:hypothetical protein